MLMVVSWHLKSPPKKKKWAKDGMSFITIYMPEESYETCKNRRMGSVVIDWCRNCHSSDFPFKTHSAYFTLSSRRRD